MNRQIEQKIQSYLPFSTQEDVWRRIEVLEAENRKITETMRQLADAFKAAIPEPREIYLSVQEVRSLTVYVRWRRKGVKGRQSFLLLNGIHGREFMLRQKRDKQELYHKFNQMTLDLNLAHSLRLNGIRRLRKYLSEVE